MCDLSKVKDCSGCHACYNICPTNCIDMKPDKAGFLYPHQNKEKCIKCGLCTKACPVIKPYAGNPKGRAFACINRNDDVRFESSSGGIFTLLAENVLNKGGVVFGAAFTDDFKEVRHICVDDKDELKKLRSSKYLQSIIGDTYRKVKAYLHQGRVVLFTGTPCQISGLTAYLGEEYENLLLQDIVCHGVPSHLLWQKYIEYQCAKNKSNISTGRLPLFRDKSTGWVGYSVRMGFDSGEEYISSASDDIYMKAFIKNMSLRESCYDCHSKSLERESDITLGDFWGVDNIAPDMNDNKGTSLVLINSRKGQQIFDEIKEDIVFKEVNIDDATLYNTSAFKSAEKPVNRDIFISDVYTLGFDAAVKKHIKENKIKKYVSALKRKMIK